MVFILLSALSSISIFILFKIFHLRKIPNLQPIIINYVTAATLGFLLSTSSSFSPNVFSLPWISISLFLGILFIVMFFLIALSSQRAGISVTTIACKMSVVIPVAFSIIYYNENVNAVKITAIILALLAVFTTVYRKGSKNLSGFSLLLPVFLFAGLGVMDVVVKYAQEDMVSPEQVPLFTAFLFLIALITGVIYGTTQRRFFRGFLSAETIGMGVLLGTCNYGSIYFIMRALNESGIDSSYVFGITNITIVAITVLVGRFAYREPMTRLNWAGTLLSLAAIYLMIFP